MNDRTKIKVIAKVREITEEWESKSKRISPKGLEIAALVTKVGGCSQASLFALVSAMIGEDIFPVKLAHRVLSAVVPTAVDNGHNYPVGKVCVLIDVNGTTNKAVKGDGSTGNNLGYEFRRATAGEVEDFFDSLPESGWEHFSVFII